MKLTCIVLRTECAGSSFELAREETYHCDLCAFRMLSGAVSPIC